MKTRSPEMAVQARCMAEQIFEPLKAVANAHGYALAVHGSLTRDIDLVLVPWTVEAVAQDTVARACIAEIERINGYVFVGENMVNVDPYDFCKRSPQPMAHGRIGWSIHLGGAGAFVDLSVFPPIANPVQALHAALDESVARQRERQRAFDERDAKENI
ncbi:MAG: hypothetical protein ABI634_02665 [Acidobacteriota bacterium]